MVVGLVAYFGVAAVWYNKSGAAKASALYLSGTGAL